MRAGARFIFPPYRQKNSPSEKCTLVWISLCIPDSHNSTDVNLAWGWGAGGVPFHSMVVSVGVVQSPSAFLKCHERISHARFWC